MPTYVTTMDSPLPPSEVWARLSDVTRFADWDPGTLRAVQVEGDGPGLGSAYRLTVKGIAGTIDLLYRVTRFDPEQRLALRADTGTLRSHDDITLSPQGTGTRVTYNAELALGGLWQVANPVLALAFRRIGRQGADGLRRFLEVPGA